LHNPDARLWVAISKINLPEHTINKIFEITKTNDELFTKENQSEWAADPNQLLILIKKK